MSNYDYINDAAVITYSTFEAVEMIPTPEDRALAYRTLILNALYDQYSKTGNPLIDMVITMARPNQVTTAQRYRKAVQNGKLGGRPSTIDRERVLELRKQGYTQNAIAEELGCHVNSIRNILRPNKDTAKKEEVEIKPTITDNNLKVKVENKIEVEVEEEVKVDVATDDSTTATYLADAVSKTNDYVNDYIIDYNPTVDCKYYTGDTFSNLLRLFGKQNYKEEKYSKYINIVERVYGCKLDDNSLNNLTCALINLKLKNKNIKMSTTKSTYDYWIVDAVKHCKQYHILRDYKNQILQSIYNEQQIINNYVLDAKEEAVAVDVADTSVADNGGYGYDNEDSHVDDDYQEGMPF